MIASEKKKNLNCSRLCNSGEQYPLWYNQQEALIVNADTVLMQETQLMVEKDVDKLLSSPVPIEISDEHKRHINLLRDLWLDFELPSGSVVCYLDLREKSIKQKNFKPITTVEKITINFLDKLLSDVETIHINTDRER